MRHRFRSLTLILLSVAVSLPATHAGIDPDSLRLELRSAAVTLTWTGGGDTYALHRASTPEDLADPANRIAVPTESTYQDPLSGIDCDPCFYDVETIDAGFECGHLLCEVADEFCLTIFPPLPEIPIDYTCQSIPELCLPVEICPCLEAILNQEWGGAAECVEGPDSGHTIIIALP